MTDNANSGSADPVKICMIITHDGRLLPGDGLSADEATRGMFQSLQSTFERALAVARQEERERCAQIAQNQVREADSEWAEGFSVAAAGIASAIRAQGE